LAIEASKALNDIPSTKRDGDDMTRNVRYTLHLDENKSSHRANSVLRQESLLHQLEEEMEDREEDVVERFEKLRDECNRLAIAAGLMKVTKVERLRINIIADVLTLNKPVSAWENFLPSPKVSLPCSADPNLRANLCSLFLAILKLLLLKASIQTEMYLNSTSQVLTTRHISSAWPHKKALTSLPQPPESPQSNIPTQLR